MKARDTLIQAEKDINEMIYREIPVTRVNETYQDAYQLYSAQLALESTGKQTDYKLVLEYSEKINSIKKIAIQAKDELKIFIETYEEAKPDTDFSGYEENYQNIINSFEDERFEDTLTLINQGYKDIIIIQSSQTATRVFYTTTTKTIKDFFINYWLELLIGIVSGFILLLIFGNRLIKYKIKRKIKHLTIQKKAVNDLIKKTQKNYFKTRKISEGEYTIKLKKYGELLRDIERQFMGLKGELYKRDRIEKEKDSKKITGKKLASKSNEMEKIGAKEKESIFKFFNINSNKKEERETLKKKIKSKSKKNKKPKPNNKYAKSTKKRFKKT